jgi:hypothetical protein
MLDRHQSVQESLAGWVQTIGVHGSLLTGEKAGKFVKTRFIIAPQALTQSCATFITGVSQHGSGIMQGIA